MGSANLRTQQKSVKMSQLTWGVESASSVAAWTSNYTDNDKWELKLTNPDWAETLLDDVEHFIEEHPQSGGVIIELPKNSFDLKKVFEEVELLNINFTSEMSVKEFSGAFCKAEFGPYQRYNQNVGTLMTSYTPTPILKNICEDLEVNPLLLASPLSHSLDLTSEEITYDTRRVHDTLAYLKVGWPIKDLGGGIVPALWTSTSRNLIPFQIGIANFQTIWSIYDFNGMPNKGEIMLIVVDIDSSYRFKCEIQKAFPGTCILEFLDMNICPFNLEELARLGIKFQVFKLSPGKIAVTWGIHGGYTTGNVIFSKLNIALRQYTESNDPNLKYCVNARCECAQIATKKVHTICYPTPITKDRMERATKIRKATEVTIHKIFEDIPPILVDLSKREITEMLMAVSKLLKGGSNLNGWDLWFQTRELMGATPPEKANENSVIYNFPEDQVVRHEWGQKFWREFEKKGLFRTLMKSFEKLIDAEDSTRLTIEYSKLLKLKKLERAKPGDKREASKSPENKKPQKTQDTKNVTASSSDKTKILVAPDSLESLNLTGPESTTNLAQKHKMVINYETGNLEEMDIESPEHPKDSNWIQSPVYSEGFFRGETSAIIESAGTPPFDDDNSIDPGSMNDSSIDPGCMNELETLLQNEEEFANMYITMPYLTQLRMREIVLEESAIIDTINSQVSAMVAVEVEARRKSLRGEGPSGSCSNKAKDVDVTSNSGEKSKPKFTPRVLFNQESSSSAHQRKSYPELEIPDFLELDNKEHRRMAKRVFKYFKTGLTDSNLPQPGRYTLSHLVSIGITGKTILMLENPAQVINLIECFVHAVLGNESRLLELLDTVEDEKVAKKSIWYKVLSFKFSDDNELKSVASVAKQALKMDKKGGVPNSGYHLQRLNFVLRRVVLGCWKNAGNAGICPWEIPQTPCSSKASASTSRKTRSSTLTTKEKSKTPSKKFTKVASTKSPRSASADQLKFPSFYEKTAHELDYNLEAPLALPQSLSEAVYKNLGDTKYDEIKAFLMESPDFIFNLTGDFEGHHPNREQGRSLFRNSVYRPAKDKFEEAVSEKGAAETDATEANERLI